jgi:hypothetical protein
VTDPVLAALYEVRTALTLERGVCPIVAQVWALRGNGEAHSIQATAELTAYCTVCQDGDDIPADCPEALRLSNERPRDVCILWNVNAETPDSGCKFCQAERAEWRCTCFRPKGEAWHKAYQRWQQRRASAEATDAGIKAKRRAYALGQRGNQVIG